MLSDTIGATTCLSSPNAAAGITTNQTTCSHLPHVHRGRAPPLRRSAIRAPSALPRRVFATTGNCGVQEFADTSTAGTNTGLPIGGVTYGAAGGGPTKYTDSPRSVTLDGTTGWGETLTGAAAPANYTIAAWVKPAALNGVILGDTNVQYDSAPADTDRMIWINAAGRIGFGNDTATLESTAAAALATGTWYFIVATKSTASGMAIYINGTSNNTVASAASKATLNYTGFWHLGWGGAVGSSFTTLPTTNFLSGSLADAAVFPAALTAIQVSTLYADTTQATFSAGVLADTPTSYWSLQDTGSTLYTGAIANLTANSAKLFADASGNPGTNYGTGQGTLGTDASGPISTDGHHLRRRNGLDRDRRRQYRHFPRHPRSPDLLARRVVQDLHRQCSHHQLHQHAGDTGDTERDRGLWLDPSGHVVFGIYPGSMFEVNSSATTSHNYADGVWHYVVITVTPVTATTGTVLMYIDGTLVAGSAADETITASQTGQAYGGWWHVGWSDMNPGGWTDGQTLDFWDGSLGQVTVFPTALSAANVTNLYGESTASAYAAAVTGAVAASNAYWPLVPAPAPTAPACSYIAMTIQAGAATCIYPVAGAACPATVPVTNWLSPVSATIPVALPTLTFTTATTLGGVTPPTTGVGLHVSVPLSITISAGGFSATLLHPIGYVLL